MYSLNLESAFAIFKSNAILSYFILQYYLLSYLISSVFIWPLLAFLASFLHSRFITCSSVSFYIYFLSPEWVSTVRNGEVRC